MEGLIFGGAYLWREIGVSQSIGLALQLEGNLPVLLCFTLYLRAISKYKPPGGLYLKGRFNGGFFALRVWGLIFGGAYTWRGLFSEFYGISTTGNKVSLVNLFALLSILQDIYRSSFSDESSRKKSSDIVKISNGRSARSLNRTSSHFAFC